MLPGMSISSRIQNTAAPYNLMHFFLHERITPREGNCWCGCLEKHIRSSYFCFCSSLYVKGTMLTGWQRYDHFAVLCELLPVALPSLAVCLSTMQYVGISEDLKHEINQKLGCSDSHPIQWSINTKATSYPQCTFPGHEIFEGKYGSYINQNEFFRK